MKITKRMMLERNVKRTWETWIKAYGPFRLAVKKLTDHDKAALAQTSEKGEK